jgi:hypothetical protein
MYVQRFPLFVGLGLILVPISLLIALLQVLVLHGTAALGIQTGGENSGALAFLVLAIGTALTLLGLGLVQAATAHALVELDRGGSIRPLRAYRMAAERIAPLFGALIVAALIVSLLASSVFLIPIAVWLSGRWALVAPTIELEGASALGALRRSRQLVRRRWFKVSSLIVAGAALAMVAGPFLGAVLILATDAPLWLVNVVAGFVYAVTMPLVALTTVYVYFDARVRGELAGEQEQAELPAEIAMR